MKKILALMAYITCFSIVTACSSISSNICCDNVVIGNDYSLPILLRPKKIILYDDSLFVMQEDPLVSYRKISQEEIDFLGSNKKIYEYFNDSFYNPTGMAELSFSESFSDSEKSHINKNGVDFYIYLENVKTKVYIVTKKSEYAIEAIIENKNQLEKLLEKVEIQGRK